jgi:carbon monoxide dehydrogenase subunit G
MPSATYRYATTVDATPARVWDGLQNPEVWGAIGPVQNVREPLVEDGALRGFSWSTEIGGVVYEGTGTAVVSDRPERYELELDTSEMTGTITVDITGANPTGSDVAVTVELRSKGLLSSLFFPIVSKAIGDALPEQVDAVVADLGSSHAEPHDS